ncbi:hypothetical protein TrVFT333_001168 [Trichoderma virens FT-333]|nr:hypothetical protein TrVFT333_001168 [Trichoderma virens FT-333]
MPSSRRDYSSSLYPEVGSSSYKSGYSNSDGNNSISGYSSRRNSTNHHSYGDYPRSRDHRHRDRNERHFRDAHSTNTKDSRRSYSHDRNRDDRKNSGGSSSSSNNTIKQRTRGIWERAIPPDYRPSQADPDARRERLSKEKECGGLTGRRGWCWD